MCGTIILKGEFKIKRFKRKNPTRCFYAADHERFGPSVLSILVPRHPALPRPLSVQAGGRLELGPAEILAAVGVAPHPDGGRNLDSGVGVHTPALAPLPVGGHVTLEHKTDGRRGKISERI